MSKSGSLSFPAGTTSQSIAITVNGDAAVEGAETFNVVLSNASGANIADATGVGTIVNDDFTDTSLTGLAVKSLHLTELRTLINELRAIRGLAAFAWTDSTLTAGTTAIKAVHVAELRLALADVYAAAGAAAPTYTDPAITSGSTVIRAAHITEIRDAAVNAP